MRATSNLSGVSRETSERLEIYLDLLRKWNPKINLVSPETLRDAWERHFLDSAQVMDVVREPPDVWADLGSGGGFPGLVLAILAHGLGWKTRFCLVESDQRKAVFLRSVSRETSVPVDVMCARIESLPMIGAQAVSARALAPLPKLLPLVARHLHESGRAYLQKGRTYQQELAEARDNLAFSLVIHPSRTDSESVILEIGNVRDV